MVLIFDISHPAHVHLYRIVIRYIQEQSHEVYIVAKPQKSVMDLLTNFNIPYHTLRGTGDTIIQKGLNQFINNLILIKMIFKNKIKLGIGSSLVLSQTTRITKMKSIIFDDDDDEVQPLFVKHAHPFCSFLFSPNTLAGKRKRTDTIYYPGYHELAYLHPNHFSPNPKVLNELGMNENDVFFIIRFNVFKAHHDIGEYGIRLSDKIRLVNILKEYGKVFITTEREIEEELFSYQLKISPEKIHSLLSYATMFIGDSQTMASEAAILGTPAIRCNTFAGRISYLNELEHKYGLTYGFHPNEFDRAIKKIQELLNIPNLKVQWQKRRQKMLADKIDLSKYMIWLVEEYPESIELTLKADRTFWQKFK